MKSTTLVLIIASIILAAHARADMKVVNDSITLMNDEEQSKGEQTSYYTEDKARLEDPTGMITIIRLDKGLMWSINTEEKSYTVQTFEDLKKQMAAIPKEMLKVEKEVKKTNETKTLRGYKCRKITAEMKMMGMTVTFTTWATKDIELDADYLKFTEKAGEAFADIPMLQTMFALMKDFTDEGYFPVTMENEVNMFAKTVNKTSLKSVSTEKIDKGLFELPEGCKEKKMGGFGGGM